MIDDTSFVLSSVSMAFRAFAIMTREADIASRAVAFTENAGAPFPSAVIATASVPHRAIMTNRFRVKVSGFKPSRDFMALAMISMDTLSPPMIEVSLAVPLVVSTLESAMDSTARLAASAAITPREINTLVVSIMDRTATEAARIPMAPAIFSSALTLICF